MNTVAAMQVVMLRALLENTELAREDEPKMVIRFIRAFLASEEINQLSSQE